MYTNIDEFPIYNWFKCIELKDYTYCAKDRTKADLNKCEVAFSEMYAQYIDTFGISDALKNILDIQNEILILKIDRAVEKDKTIDTFIALKELELAEKMDKEL